MTRSELIARIKAANSHLRYQDVERIVSAVLDTIADSLRQGNRVELRGFGTFSVKDRAPRIARDPGRGRTVHVDSRRILHFKSSKLLNKRLNAALEPPDSPAPETVRKSD